MEQTVAPKRKRKSRGASIAEYLILVAGICGLSAVISAFVSSMTGAEQKVKAKVEKAIGE